MLLGSSLVVSSISIEDEVKQKLDKDNGLLLLYYNYKYLIYTVIAHSDILYTGMMYHEEKKNTHWKTMYTVVRDLDVLIEV